jgi:ribosomal protein S18 acetylase RimI-like enzyme
MVEYRPATPEDSATMAELIRIAAGGVVDFLFHDLIQGVTPVQILANGLKRDNPTHSFRNAVMAVSDQEVIGVALSYPSEYHGVSEALKNFVPPDRLDHLAAFYEARVEKSLYLDSLAVFDRFRGQGVGGRLISLTKEKALAAGYDKVSLIALADNAPALSVYRQHGFEVVADIPIEPHEFIPHQGGSLLLAAPAGQGESS